MKIYVVFGQTGEYSDNRRWMVKAFKTKAQAEALVLEADRQAAEFYAKYRVGRYHYPDPGDDGVPKGTEADPNIDCDYTGTSYYYGEVELQ